jgi:4-hydroxy-tetrahydrodipicolinate synthase
LAILAKKPADFLFLSGDDMLTVPLIACGAVGIITVLGNAFPQKFSDMTRAALAGDFARAQQLLFGFVGLNPLMYEEGNPVGVKAALALQGVCSADVRLPLVPASAGLTARIKALL